MHVIADLQLHSKYSRAVSGAMNLPTIYSWAQKKGIGLIATGDFTHPLWMKDIQEQLEETGTGFLQLNKRTKETALRTGAYPSFYTSKEPLFVLETEVSCIYSQQGKGRRVHTLIWVPSLASATSINKEMTKRGCNLLSDGRPIIGLTSIELAELVLSIEPKALIIPAHAWTPWFSLYGSKSGFNSIDDAFGSYAQYIYAIETGLSSNPAMNWQIEELDDRSIVSFSDAHSGPKLAREATVFDLAEMTFSALYEAISAPFTHKISPSSTIAYTIEFYPEEGKYHFSGHRSCAVRWNIEETQKNGSICPVCGKPLVQGVVQRVAELSGRSEESLQLVRTNHTLNDGQANVSWISSRLFPHRPPFVMLVPLLEIIAESIESSVTSKKTLLFYEQMIRQLDDELTILLRTSVDEIKAASGERIAEAIEKVRIGNVYIDPGYDGVFGVVKLWHDGEVRPLIDSSREQLRLLDV